MAGATSGALPHGVGDRADPHQPRAATTSAASAGAGRARRRARIGTRSALYATAAPLDLTGQPDGDAVRKALGKAQVLGKAVLKGTYRRGG